MSYTKTYVNELTDTGTWVLTFGRPYMDYDGPTVEVDEATAQEILAIQNT